MQALFLLWCGEYLVRVEYLQVVGNTDLPATAFRALKRTMLDEETLTADRCTIYLIKDRKLILAGEEGDGIGV